MHVERAVVMAGGTPGAGELPEALRLVGRRPAITLVLDGLRSAALTDVVVVTGHQADAVEGELGNGGAAGMQLNYVRQDPLDGTAAALARAKETLGDGGFFFSHAEVLVHPDNYGRVLSAGRLADGAVAVCEGSAPTTGAPVTLDTPAGNGYVTGIAEAPTVADEGWWTAGFGVLPPEAWEVIGRLQPAREGQSGINDVINGLAQGGTAIRAVPVEGPCVDISRPEQLAEAGAALGVQP